MMAVLCLMLFCMMGCKTVKSSTTEKTETSDSVIIKTVEKVVKVPVTVYVEVPSEEKERLCNDSTSHLETSFAVSEASMIWIDGVPFLNHKLANKPQRIEKPDTVFVTVKDSTSSQVSNNNNTKTEYIKQEPTFWEKLYYSIWGAVVGAIIGAAFTFVILLRFRKC